jgi:integrase
MTEWTPEMREAARERAKGRRQPKGAGSLFRTTVGGETVWRATKSLTRDGKKKTITGTSPSKSEALKRRDLNERKWLVAQGLEDPVILIEPDAKVWTVGEWLTKWAESQSEEAVQPNTRQRNRGLIKNHIVPHLGTRKLIAVREEHVQQLFKETLPNKRDENGQPLLGSSPIRSVFYILRDAFMEAEREGLIKQTPMKYLTAPKKQRKTPLTIADRMDDLPKLLAFLNQPEHAADDDYWALALFGLRASERLGLEWECITGLEDLTKSAVLTIDRQLYNDAEHKTLHIKMRTKTEAGTRTLPLPESVRKKLRSQLERQKEQKKSPKWQPRPGFENLIFTNSTGNPVRQAKDNMRWRKLVEDAGLAPLRGHDMRHMTASFLAEIGQPVEVVQAILGHQSAAMSSYYTHLSRARTLKALTSLADAYVYDMARYRDGKPKAGLVILTKPLHPVS